MPDALQRFLPTKVPAFDREGSSFDWGARPIKWSDAADLPIAYLRPGQEAMDPAGTLAEIYYAGTQAPGQFMPVRRPNVLMVDTEERADELLADATFVQAADRLGILLCRATVVPVVDGASSFDPGTTRPALRGMPLVANPDLADTYLANPTEKYAGGRLLILLDTASDLAGYLDYEKVDNLDYQAQDGGAFCVTSGYAPGTAPIPDEVSPDTPVTSDFVLNETFQSNIDADIAYLLAAEGRFDRLKIVTPPFTVESLTYDIPVAVSCFDAIAGANTLVFPSPATIEGTNEPFASDFNDALDGILTQFEDGTSGILTRTGMSVAAIIEFFEGN